MPAPPTINTNISININIVLIYVQFEDDKRLLECPCVALIALCRALRAFDVR